VRCWGSNRYGQLALGDTTNRSVPTPVPALTGAIAIGAGDQHACAIFSGGLVKCWGANYTHQLGLGESQVVPDGGTVTQDMSPHPTPANVCASGTGFSCAPLMNATKVVGSSEATCAIVGTGVRCWGSNPAGGLGNNTFTLPATANPVQVCEPSGCGAGNLGDFNGGIVDLAMGLYFVCGIDGVGATYCWGDNNSGAVGLDSNTIFQIALPNNLTTVNTVTQKAIAIATTSYGACAIVSDGNTANNLVRCWGNGLWGQRGNATSGSNAYGPTVVTACSANGCAVNFTGATSISGTTNGFCAVAGGAVWCWGANTRGEAGVGSLTNTQFTVATKTTITSGAIGVSSENGNQTMCARLNAGGVMRCWGANDSAQLGNGMTAQSVPTPTAQSW
jgi:alpha-tubulin suppressor-like RCC1 family protein